MFGQDISLLVPIKQTAESRVRGLFPTLVLIGITKVYRVAVLLIDWLIIGIVDEFDAILSGNSVRKITNTIMTIRLMAIEVYSVLSSVYLYLK